MGVEHISKDTTDLLKSTDQGALANFKVIYLRNKPTVTHIGKKSIIMHAVDNVAASLNKVKSSTLNGS